MKNMSFKNEKGFTLIELLIVVGIVAILSGVLVSVIDAPAKRNQTQDAVNLNRLRDAASSIETMRLAEGVYPGNGVSPSFSPLTQGDPVNLATAQIYINQWPGDTFLYFTNGTNFSIFVRSLVDGNTCYKYLSNRGQTYLCRTNTYCGRNLNFSTSSCSVL